MSESKQPKNYSPHQQKIINRYYDNVEQVSQQRLAELVAELYLCEGKKLQTAWKQAAAAMQKLGVSPARIEHLVAQQNPSLVAELVKELEGKKR